MSTEHSNPLRQTDALRLPVLAAAAALSLAFLSPAYALSSDHNQPIKVDAAHFVSSRSGTTVLTGHVVITQGSMIAKGDKGTAHTNADHSVKRLVLNGTPATLQQTLDNGSQMHARADTIDYQVGTDTITLNGHAQVVQQGQGQYNGAHLVYNTRTGAIQGEGGEQGRVHLILQPRTPAAASSAAGTH
ncbi:MAG: lipopolysaccharide transport periplasmic protein LptA [Xanthomonadales bacterium]|nr:lipopolysaccharide transport periplasmic protein LptA [Xanthomonadales bacterium]